MYVYIYIYCIYIYIRVCIYIYTASMCCLTVKYVYNIFCVNIEIHLVYTRIKLTMIMHSVVKPDLSLGKPLVASNH